MNNVTIKQLEYFVAAVQTGSLSGAARMCHISHAGIADGINELERSLGTSLLVRRKGKGVAPTAAGRAVLPLARNVLRDTASIELLGHAGQDELSGELSVHCTLALSPVLLPLIASVFAEQHPRVKLAFRESGGAEVIQAVREGEADAGLVFQRQLVEDLDYVTICPIEVKIALPPQHPLAGRESVSLKELSGEPVVAPQGAALEALVSVMREAGVEPRIRWSLASPETIRAMVARGFGYSLLYVFPSVPETGTPDVAAVPVSDDLSANALVLVVPPRRRQTALVERLAEILQAKAASSIHS